MSRIIPAVIRIRSIQDVMRTEAECWRAYGRDLEADGLETYARMLEKVRQQMLEEKEEVE